MRQINPNEIREIIIDIENEMARLEELAKQVKFVQLEMAKNPEYVNIFTESLALKLHNFYTGCERIFQIIASELNGGLPSSYDRHRRLLTRMGSEQAERPAILQEKTVRRLTEYLSFRHVVRNIYGFELQQQRVTDLVENYYQTWQSFKQDIDDFLLWLKAIVENLQP